MNGPQATPQELQVRGTGRPVQYVSLNVRTLLRQAAEAHGPWHWVVNPYSGCEFACTHCHARLERRDHADWVSFEQRVRVKANAVEAFLREIRASDFEKRQVVLGSHSEPWQQAEESFRLTRALLEAMLQVDGVDLRINTRSSLIARDTDLLRQLSKKGRVVVSFSIPSMDEHVNRLMEPRAPSAFRRLAAMEALARAGVTVGLSVSPVFAGIDEEELGLETLLTRAAHAGARFSGMQLMTFAPGQRETFLNHVTQSYPDSATRFRRLIGRRPLDEDQEATLHAKFNVLCHRLGLMPLHNAVSMARAAPRKSAEQLTLFAMENLA